MTDQPQWKTTMREDSDGSKIVGFSLEGELGHIHMDAPAGDLDLNPGDLDYFVLAAQLRGRAKSCVISWRYQAQHRPKAVEVRVVAGRIMVSKLNGAMLALGDRVQGEIGDQDPESLISHVRSLV